MENQLDISVMTTEQLEALAYRLVEQKSNLEMNLATVQQQIAKKRQEAQTAQLDLLESNSEVSDNPEE